MGGKNDIVGGTAPTTDDSGTTVHDSTADQLQAKVWDPGKVQQGGFSGAIGDSSSAVATGQCHDLARHRQRKLERVYATFEQELLQKENEFMVGQLLAKQCRSVTAVKSASNGAMPSTTGVMTLLASGANSASNGALGTGANTANKLIRTINLNVLNNVMEDDDRGSHAPRQGTGATVKSVLTASPGVAGQRALELACPLKGHVDRTGHDYFPFSGNTASTTSAIKEDVGARAAVLSADADGEEKKKKTRTGMDMLNMDISNGDKDECAAWDIDNEEVLNEQLAKQAEKVRFNDLSDLPTMQELDSAGDIPVPDEQRNPAHLQSKSAFVPGRITKGWEKEAVIEERVRREGCERRGVMELMEQGQVQVMDWLVPDCRRSVKELVARGVLFDDYMEKDFVPRRMDGGEYKMEQQGQWDHDETMLACLQTGVVELFARHEKAGVVPEWTLPSACVPKKVPPGAPAENRLIFDGTCRDKQPEGIDDKFRGPNVHMSRWHQKYDDIKHIHCIIKQGYKIWTADFTKFFWSMLASEAHRLTMRTRLRRAWVNKALAAAARRMGKRRAEMDDVTALDWKAVGKYDEGRDRGDDADEWVTVMVNWTCMPMGLKVSSPVLISLVRQLLKTLRRVHGIGVLTYVDDLFGGEADELSPTQPAPGAQQQGALPRMRVDDSIESVIWHTTMAGVQCNFPKSWIGAGGHDVVVWKGVIVDAKQGKFFARPSSSWQSWTR